MSQCMLVPLKTASIFARRVEESSLKQRRSAAVRARSLSGKWHKDQAKSDSMQETADLFHLTFVARRGAALANNLKIDDTDSEFSTHVKPGSLTKSTMQALVITINETYPKTGEKRRYSRRDLRRGGIEGAFETSKEGHPCVRVTWGEPYSGVCVDKYELSDDGKQILQTSTYTRDSSGKTTVFKTVWHRA